MHSMMYLLTLPSCLTLVCVRRGKQACDYKSFISRLVGTTTFTITLEGTTVKQLTKGLKVANQIATKPAKARSPLPRPVFWDKDGEFFSKVSTLSQCFS
jgi:hypothetical protein